MKFLLVNDGKKSLFGNGGSAQNSTHIENGMVYGLRSKNIPNGLNIESINSNTSVITCLANDVGYDFIFSEQLISKAQKNDLLIVLSGSGNSKNILNALKTAKKLDLKTFSLLGFDGGDAIKISEKNIHIKSYNMQVVEDVHMIIFHLITRFLSSK